MQLIRAVLSALILFFDRTFAPKPEVRSLEHQTKVNTETTGLSLYLFEACPFCVKVRRHIQRRALNIETRDVKRNKAYEKELIAGGGQIQVPCLRITNPDGSVRWLYESGDIIAYLDTRFPHAPST